MTSNISLEKSLLIRNAMSKDLSSVFETEFPFEIKSFNESQRDRIYNSEKTLLTMIHSSVHEDRSLQNSVLIFNEIHNRNIAKINELETELKASVQGKRKGRLNIQKSKRKPISTRTGGYSQARTRLDMDYVLSVYKASTETYQKTDTDKFYGRQVFITDGTYLQLQDTEAIKEKFNNSVEDGYPRGLLSAIIDQSSGLIVDFTLDSDKKSELELFGSMIKNMPSNSLLLADDLYNCSAIFSLLKNRGVDIIVPGKRQRNYKVIKSISEGDEIVEINLEQSKSKISKLFNIDNQTIRLRRIEIDSPNENKTIVLYTTILDELITKFEIYLKYFTRWDIEISIREIKSIMSFNVLRGQSPEMALKELCAGLIAYNYIRKIIAKSVENTDFSPESNIFQEYYKNFTIGYVDKLGREYSKHSTGRQKFAI
jgi:hypothetical protein